MAEAPASSAVRTRVRQLEEGDYHKGFMELLGQLSVAGEVSEEAFKARLSEMGQRGGDYYTAVVEDQDAGRVIGAATVLVELKFMRGCGSCGHIEDVVVDSTYRGQRLGQRLIEELVRYARGRGCYKVILDCSEANAPFYEKCGLQRKEVQMARYF